MQDPIPGMGSSRHSCAIGTEVRVTTNPSCRQMPGSRTAPHNPGDHPRSSAHRATSHTAPCLWHQQGAQRPSKQMGTQLQSQSTKLAVLHSSEAAADSLFVGFPPQTVQGSRAADKAKQTCPCLAVKQGICFQQHIKGLWRSRKYIPLCAP